MSASLCVATACDCFHSGLCTSFVVVSREACLRSLSAFLLQNSFLLEEYPLSLVQSTIRTASALREPPSHDWHQRHILLSSVRKLYAHYKTNFHVAGQVKGFDQLLPRIRLPLHVLKKRKLQQGSRK
eukprot:6184275-Pleurochrysis_carterae.AAC.1